MLVLEDWFDGKQAHQLITHAHALARNAPSDAAIFSTRTHAHVATRYFLDSARGIRCFLEEDALDEDGERKGSSLLSVNKIGHALHALDPQYKAFSDRIELYELANALGLLKPRPIQSMIIFKPPRIGGEVVWHQDATFLYTEPSSVIGFWFALEAANRDNGCLWALPGHHRDGLKRRFVRSGDSLSFEEINKSPWPNDDAVPIEVAAGTLVILHGSLPHYSAPNRSDRSRIAYSLHFVDNACVYSPDNWLQPS